MDKKRREGIPSKNYLLFIQKENKSIACFLCYKLIIRGRITNEKEFMATIIAKHLI